MRALLLLCSLLQGAVGDSCTETDLSGYEARPIVSGTRCVQGSGDGWDSQQFVVKKEKQSVRSIKIWGDHDPRRRRGARRRTPILAVGLNFGDGSDNVQGYPNGDPDWSMDFLPGEHLIGDVVISTNPDNVQRVGFISLTKSDGTTLSAGDPGGTQYRFPSGESFLAGMAGDTHTLDDGGGHDLRILTGLGFIFWKPVDRVTIDKLSYPDIDSLTKVKTPSMIAQRDYCNADGTPKPTSAVSQSETHSEGVDSEFSFSMGFQFGETVTISGGIPLLEKVEAGYNWQMSGTRSQQTTKHVSDSITSQVTFPEISIPARTEILYSFTQWRGAVDRLRYNAEVTVYFKDKSTFVSSESGYYTGAHYLTMEDSWSQSKSVTTCDGHNAEVGGLAGLNYSLKAPVAEELSV